MERVNVNPMMPRSKFLGLSVIFMVIEVRIMHHRKDLYYTTFVRTRP